MQLLKKITFSFSIGLIFLFSLKDVSAQAEFCPWFCSSSSVCFSCDLEGDLSGFYSKAIFLMPELVVIDPICNGYNANNSVWFAFVAGSSDLSITVSTSNCGFGSNPGQGIQIGLLDECGASTCVAADLDCPASSVLNISTSELVVGNKYFLFLDGCAGWTCDFDLEIDHAPFELKEPSSISALDNCTEECLTTDNCLDETDCAESEFIEVLSGMEVLFKARQEGCSFYNPDMQNVTIEWRFNLETHFSNQNGLILEMPIVEEEFHTSICLKKVTVNNGCEAATEDEVCLDVVVLPPNTETFTYAVCEEELRESWQFPFGDDPNGDGIEWLGASEFELDEVLDWDDGCETHELRDPECNIPVVQTLCIEIISPLQEVELYMYECQFDEFDEYNWIWS